MPAAVIAFTVIGVGVGVGIERMPASGDVTTRKSEAIEAAMV